MRFGNQYGLRAVSDGEMSLLHNTNAPASLAHQGGLRRIRTDYGASRRIRRLKTVELDNGKELQSVSNVAEC